MGIDRPLGALLAGAVSIAALHALIPSHWLAFAVVGRRQNWTARRTLTVTALAGLGHALLTIALGLLLASAGKEAAKKNSARHRTRRHRLPADRAGALFCFLFPARRTVRSLAS